MSAPVITLYNSDHSSLLSVWNAGTVKAQEPSTALVVNIWNNKGGSSDISDLKDCVIGVYDSNGTTSKEDVAKDKWVEINVESVDGSDTVWTPIGGTTTKQIRANSGVTDFSISGAANTGAETATKNYSTIKLRINAPINSTPGNKQFKIRLTGYYT